MYKKQCLSLMSAYTIDLHAYRFSSILFLTLIFSVFFTYPSFADKDLNAATAEANVAALAQVFMMPKDSSSIKETIIDCSAKNRFTDDSALLYDDFDPRSDTITICPPNPWQTVKITFTDFSLANGDTLYAYDGNLEAFREGKAPIIGKNSGEGISKAFGGWLASSCSPATNPSGCLTFYFATNGDYAKGRGWDAWVNCEDKNIVITPPSIPNPRITCNRAYWIQTIGPAMVTADCGNILNDSTIVKVANATGKVWIDTCLSKNENMTLTDTFGLGTYVVTYQLKSDLTKTATTYFSINAPSLVCNDHLSFALGSGCSMQIMPDMILENPCDTILDTLYYQIAVKTKSGNILAQGSGRAGDYPIITKEMIDFCGQTNYVVEITRNYYSDLALSFHNNGPQTITCSADVSFKDYTPPFFTKRSSTDTIYACDLNLNEEELSFTRPTVVDNCSKATVSLFGTSQVNVGNACNETATYLVSWEAKDGCGNTAILKDTIRVMRPGLDKLVEASNIVLSCGEDPAYAINGLEKTGMPGLMTGIKKNGVFTPTDTISLSTTEYVCSYILKKEDQAFPSTCGTKYFRNWTLLDWCDSQGPVTIGTQLIQFKDTLAPVIKCTAFTSLETAEKMTISPFQCTEKVFLTAPEASDNCDVLPAVKMYTVERRENGAWWKIADNLAQSAALSADTFRVGWRAFDTCPEQTKEDSCFQYFILEDKTKPTAICEDLLNISMSNDFARIRAEDIDAGSWDACGIEKILIRRSTCGNRNTWAGSHNAYVAKRLNNKLDPTGWGEYVDFACCDIHQRIKIELLVIDNNGNYNFCWMEVEPEDKINPLCVNLPDQKGYCDDFHTNELGLSTDTDQDGQFDSDEWIKLQGDLEFTFNEKYGKPFSACIDNLTCNDFSMEQQYQLLNLECGVIQLKRRYRARDWNGNVSNWAEQHINVEYRPDWAISLPVDWTGTCGDGVPTANLIIENGTCDLMGYEVYDQTFEIVNDACFKVIRTYYIINWCKYQAGDQPHNITRIADSKGDVVINQVITSDQFGDFSYLKYTQILKVSDAEAPKIIVSEIGDCLQNANGCSDTKTFSVTATDCNEASNNSLEYRWEILENTISRTTGYGKEFDWVVKTGIHYTVKWRVFDKCGNSAWEEKNYFFKDCKKPNPYCLDGGVLEMGQDGEVAIWASDLDLYSTDNCTSKEKLDLRIWHQSLSEEAPTILEEVRTLPTGLTLDCRFFGFQKVNIYVIDEFGNYDFCIAEVEVQDNMDACQGKVAWLAGKSIPSTEKL